MQNHTQTNDTKKNANDKMAAALRIRLANISDELELYGWRASDLARYVRDARKVLALESVVALFAEMLDEERAYYHQHAPLLDDQLDHTDLAG